MLFFWNFLLRVGNGIERNGMTNFIFSISMRFTTNFGLKWSHNDIFKFSNYLATFLEFSISCRVGTKTEWCLLYSLFLGLYQPILAWNEAIIVFFNFLNFFAIFFWIFYFVSCRNGTERNDSFLLCIFLPILAWKEPIMVFFNFLNLFAILLEFSITRRVGRERTDNFYFFFFSAFPNLFCLEMKL